MTAADAGRLLTATDLPGYLYAAGVTQSRDATARPLPGGVSCATHTVVDGSRRLVVKQARHRLQVDDDWWVTPARIVTEAQALEWARRTTPASVPAVVHLDPARYLLVVEHAPEHWADWKAQLLTGSADTSVGAALGTVLASWHDAPVDDTLADLTQFEELRLQPYHDTVATRRPQVAARVRGLREELRRAEVFVHGDFSPKNVLVGADGCWVIDFEVAHRGAATFDLAFLLSHLVLKALRRPATARQLGRVAGAFLDAYAAGRGGERPALDQVAPHVGALLLARVVGRSPVEYLRGDEPDAALRLGDVLLLGRDASSRLDAFLTSGRTTP